MLARCLSIIHTVQLADKTLPVVVLEELWQDRVGKFDAVIHIKHVAFLGPGDEVLDIIILYHSISKRKAQTESESRY
jgi:hypothetical protein